MLFRGRILDERGKSDILIVLSWIDSIKRGMNPVLKNREERVESLAVLGIGLGTSPDLREQKLVRVVQA